MELAMAEGSDPTREELLEQFAEKDHEPLPEHWRDRQKWAEGALGPMRLPAEDNEARRKRAIRAANDVVDEANRYRMARESKEAWLAFEAIGWRKRPSAIRRLFLWLAGVR